tara:strand:- start:1500 stop:2669 length:1170 start_codon:yes stop_codon:yes gene_type:complete
LISTKALIVGSGYVGTSYACLISDKHPTYIDEIDKEKISLLKKNKSILEDKLINKTLKKNKKNLFIYNGEDLNNFNFIIVCLPTNYNSVTDYFDLEILEKKIDSINKKNYKNLIVLKSTVPVGFTNKLIKKYPKLNIVFSPEFLREGSALEDARNPSRNIAGGKKEHCDKFNRFISKLHSKNTSCFVTSSSEAEAIKLFSNTYLAMRISFFNELDSYSIEKNLNTRNIIEGVCADKRIGDYYNNPSFGYGGYCLPKDTKQLLANYNEVPQKIISSIVEANLTRKEFIAKKIDSFARGKTLGIYRLLMKKEADNYRESSILDVIKILKKMRHEILIYEPKLTTNSLEGLIIENDFNKFVKKSEIIIANRVDSKIRNFQDKVFTRDIFSRD